MQCKKEEICVEDFDHAKCVTSSKFLENSIFPLNFSNQNSKEISKEKFNIIDFPKPLEFTSPQFSLTTLTTTKKKIEFKINLETSTKPQNLFEIHDSLDEFETKEIFIQNSVGFFLLLKNEFIK